MSDNNSNSEVSLEDRLKNIELCQVARNEQEIAHLKVIYNMLFRMNENRVPAPNKPIETVPESRKRPTTSETSEALADAPEVFAPRVMVKRGREKRHHLYTMKPCLYCQGPHPYEYCNCLRDHASRTEFMKKNGICLSCASPVCVGLIGGKCARKTRKCIYCPGRHLNALCSQRYSKKETTKTK